MIFICFKSELVFETSHFMSSCTNFFSLQTQESPNSKLDFLMKVLNYCRKINKNSSIYGGKIITISSMFEYFSCFRILTKSLFFNVFFSFFLSLKKIFVVVFGCFFCFFYELKFDHFLGCL
jgi:hypothetical protein